MQKIAWILWIIALTLNAVWHYFGLWSKINESDTAIHFFTTFSVTFLLASYFLKVTPASSRKRIIFLLLVFTSFGLSLGGIWEMLEAMVPEKTNGEGRTDVVSDLFFDFIGAFAAASVAIWVVRRQKR